MAAALMATFAFAGHAQAATFTPTTFEDNNFTTNTVDLSDCASGSTDPCSLREAVESANETPGDDDVPLAEGTYELNPDFGSLFYRPLTTPPSQDQTGMAAGSLLVHGQGARVSTIDANGSEDHNRIFEFIGGAVVEMRDLGMTGGSIGDDEGGAIEIRDDQGDDAVVTLRRVWVYDNHDVDSDGGAIKNNGKLSIFESLLSGNTAGDDGGAIENDDELTIVNSTLTGNTAGTFEESSDGGAINNDGQQAEFFRGGPRSSSLTEVPEEAPFVRVSSSTIAGNSAPNGNGGGVATTEEDTCPSIGGDCNGPRAYALFHNSIVSDNSADGDDNCSGNFPADDPDFASSQGYNLEDGDTCLFKATGDKLAPSGLAALANNGGGTDTRKLLDGSVAIDGGDPANCEAIDQRGVTRPQRRTCDIGAFEREPDPARPVEQQPQAQPELPQPITPQGDVCRDRKPPVTVLRNPGLTVSGDSVKLEGTSRDLGAPCRSGVQRVEVSMAKVSGTDLNCRFLRRSNRFVITPFRNCRQPVLFKAEGTTEWSFTFRGVLSPGKYRAQARAYDAARNKETPKKRRNIVYFEVQ
jgi:hypothetical protein